MADITKTCTTADSTSTTTVVTETDPTASTTTTTTTNQQNSSTCQITETENTNAPCGPCAHFDLKKLAEESRAAAFRSSNIAAATSNSVIIFTMLVLQELLIKECKKNTLDLDAIFLISNAISNLGDGITITNPQALNS